MKTALRSPLIIPFFGFTFALSWLIWIPLAISHLGKTPFIPEGTSNAVRLLGVLGPAIVAILLTAYYGGRKAIAELAERLKIWRVGWGWWGVVALVQPVLLVAVALAYNGLGGKPGLSFGGQVTAVEFIVQVVMLAIATLGEEIGWRGFALPELLKTNGALKASLVLGAVWSVWHIPFWLLQDSFDRYGPGYLIINFLMIIPMTVYITWFFKHTRGSILLAAVFHLTFNIVNVVVVSVTSLIEPYLAFVAVQWVVALLLIWRYGRETLAQDLFSGT